MDKFFFNMEISTMPSSLSHPAYLINYTSGTILASLQPNSSRPHLLTILTHTTSHPLVPGQNSDQGGKGSLGDNGEDDDSFGEHYFHICIYIWACVVISSLIALSVVIFHIAIIRCQKWGCCGRSLTRWEVKRIPLKRFQRVEGDDSQEKCPICHEEFHEERLIRQLPCNHCYHSYCVDRWLVKMSNRCPLCKQRVSISLLCPWNKQRRKKETNGQLASDVEASVDESPPLPPLSTLTPSNWYGEEIMSESNSHPSQVMMTAASDVCCCTSLVRAKGTVESNPLSQSSTTGPSKFIILRPGRPTRVIDVREKTRASFSHKSNPCKGEETCQPADINIASCNSLHFDETVEEQVCKTDVCDILNIDIATKNTTSVTSLFEGNDILSADIQIPSICSSRSCSISSDQPLLFQNQCNCGDESDSQDIDELVESGDRSKRTIPLTPLLYPQEISSLLPSCTHEHVCKSLPRIQDIEYRTTAKTIVTLSSRSSSVVSCNIKPSDTETAIDNPSTNITHTSSKHSATMATRDRSKCTSDGKPLFHPFIKNVTLCQKALESHESF